jgi:hypothetical protein
MNIHSNFRNLLDAVSSDASRNAAVTSGVALLGPCVGDDNQFGPSVGDDSVLPDVTLLGPCVGDDGPVIP